MVETHSDSGAPGGFGSPPGAGRLLQQLYCCVLMMICCIRSRISSRLALAHSLS